MRKGPDMEQPTGLPFVERLRFFNGQQLFASDLQSIEEFDRSMRWLHNSSLHQLGIGNGFAVSGRRGHRDVTVQPGYAIAMGGKEIVLLEPYKEQVPPVSGEPDGKPAYFDLTVSYPSDDDLEEAETREGVCLPRGAVRLQEKPVFCWVRLRRDANGNLQAVDPVQAARIQAGMLIMLARAEVLNCQLNADLSIVQRRQARPPQQPVIRCATVGVTWEPWSYNKNSVIGLKTTVDTRAAGFRSTPCYSARISGDRPLTIKVDKRVSLALIDGPAYIQDPTADDFGCFIPVFDLEHGRRTADELQIAIKPAGVSWRVTWLAVED
jgi:hypothetical protein